ncbi:MAG TPA: DapH/DapD/GlmU-related protein [Lacisediminihabitans sp.]|uniref:N-acetyltransferase n=1 Tax=Lacisediminihabitans sp. TaxID=2787631 RepID=UPI002EDB483B
MTIHAGATIDPGATVAESVTVWQGTHVRSGAVIAANTSLGQYVYVGPGARIGAGCKVQNGAYIYEPAEIEDGVFIGPRVVLTNDRHPRAIMPDGRQKGPDDWEPVGVTIRRGASIGAGAICVAPVEIGRWATVAAGSVVVDDVADHALMAGVPARRIGWVGRSGVTLRRSGGLWICPVTGEAYEESAGESSIRRIDPTTTGL